MTYTVLALLIAFQVKHLLADYFFQTDYMLKKFSPTGWVKPLAAHAGVHAYGTLFIGVCLMGYSWYLIPAVVFDFVVHFCMDRIKADPSLMGRWKALSAKEWQMCKGYVNDKSANPEIRHAAILCQEKLNDNKRFWHCIGIDQLVHHLTHYAIILYLVSM